MRVLRFLLLSSSRYWLVLIYYSKFGWPSDWLAEKSTWPLYLPHSSLDGGILPLDSSLIRCHRPALAHFSVEKGDAMQNRRQLPEQPSAFPCTH